jgi:hypothetical protein
LNGNAKPDLNAAGRRISTRQFGPGINVDFRGQRSKTPSRCIDHSTFFLIQILLDAHHMLNPLFDTAHERNTKDGNCIAVSSGIDLS